MSSPTRQALLEETERLLRTCGYNAFSYADLSKAVSIRKASIHHHFPTKENLGSSLLDHYVRDFSEFLDNISAEHASALDAIRTYARISFFQSLEDGLLPLCGALAANSAGLPESMKAKTRQLFELHLSWLTRAIDKGIKEGSFASNVVPSEAAAFILSLLEGASLVDWTMGGSTRSIRSFEMGIESLRVSTNAA